MALPADAWTSLAWTGLKWLAFFAAVAVVGGLLFAWSGLYSVAASRGHWPFFESVLEFGMRNSVDTHASDIAIPDLSSEALADRGAGHFQGGCAPCHGAPGQDTRPIARAMLPEPPDLSASVPTWAPNELFWIVMNGLKYTGMPGWAAPGRDDEVWAVVAFLTRLPALDEPRYRRMSGLDPFDRPVSAEDLARGGPAIGTIAGCARCHGLDGRGRPNGAFPRLDIQSADYLLAQLRAYATGSRRSGIMEPAAAVLDDHEMRRLAVFYARPQPPPNASDQSSPGAMLAASGLPEGGVPACLSCHNATRHPYYPALVGQYATYIADQLRVFRAGYRRSTAAGEIMTAVARRLTDRQIDDVAAHFAAAGSP